MEKILIGTPIYEKDQQFLEGFLDSIKNQSKKSDLIFADNSKNNNLYIKLKQEKLIVIKTKHQGNKYEDVFQSRKKIVEYFLKKDYTHLFWVDSDIILQKDTLSTFLNSKKEIVSGVYLSLFNYNGLKLIHPVAYKLTHDKNLRLPLQLPEVKKNSIIEVHSVGFGCCLIKREVLEKINLRRIPKTTSTEDVLFCHDSRKKGYKTFLNTSILCKHGLKTKQGIKYIDATKYL